MNKRDEKLKKALFMCGKTALEDFCDVDLSVYNDKDVIEKIVDDVIEQMPEEEYEKYYRKYVSA